MEPLSFNSGTTQVKGETSCSREKKKEKGYCLVQKSNYVQEERSCTALKNVIGVKRVLSRGEEGEAGNTNSDVMYIYTSLMLPEVRTGQFQNPSGCVSLL